VALDTGAREGLARNGASQVRDSEETIDYQFRAGGHVLSLFSRALHSLVLKALADGPMRLAELREAVGGPPQTTLRGNLGNLIGMGALERRHGQGNLVDNALTPVGTELRFVAEVLESWLARAPRGPLVLDSETGKSAVKALVGGWGSTMLRALAARPCTLTQLDNLINAFSYPALERRLSSMRLAGYVAALEPDGGGTPYAVTPWLRQAMAPLLAAIRCERRHMAAETAPLTRIDVETILLLTAPLVRLPPEAEGPCQLTVQGGEDSEWRAAGLSAWIENGRISHATSKLGSNPQSWIGGSAATWLDAIVEGQPGLLEAAGDRALTTALVDGLHRALFSP